MKIANSLLAGAVAAFMSSAAAGQMNPAAQQAGQQPGQAAEQAAEQPAQQQADDKGSGGIRKATSADIKAGASVYDSDGNLVGKIDSVDSDGATIDTGNVKAKLSISSFARDNKGLLIGMSKSKLEQAAKSKQ
jgi:hypothetical protein